MVDQISTLAAFQNAMNDINTVQARLLKEQSQITSGKISDTYLDLNENGPIENYISLNDQLNNINNYSTNNLTIINRLTTMDQALNNIINTASKMRDDLTTRMSSSGRSMNLTQIAKENYLPTIRDNLNFEFQGRYLFAGSRTDAPPVGDIVNNSNVMNGAITSNYYNGNSVLLTASASNSLDVAYGINADNQIFQNLIACANKIITADTNNDQIGISQAFDIANTAINDLTQLRATLDNNLSAIQDVNTDFTNQQIYLTSMISNTEQTDFPKVTAQLISDQTSLTASYKAFAMMSKMNLGNFLGN